MSEEERAAAYRVQLTNREAFRRFLLRTLVAPDTEAQRIRTNVAPLLERTKLSEREPEEERPVEIANS